MRRMKHFCSLEIIKYLVEKGFELNVADDEDQPPLHCTCYSRNLEIFSRKWYRAKCC